MNLKLKIGGDGKMVRLKNVFDFIEAVEKASKLFGSHLINSGFDVDFKEEVSKLAGQIIKDLEIRNMKQAVEKTHCVSTELPPESRKMFEELEENWLLNYRFI